MLEERGYVIRSVGDAPKVGDTVRVSVGPSIYDVVPGCVTAVSGSKEFRAPDGYGGYKKKTMFYVTVEREV